MWAFGLAVPVFLVMAFISPVAAVAAIVLATVGLLALKGGVNAAFEGWAGLEFIGAWIGARRRTGGLAGLEWFCGTCRSLNNASTAACYRGCGPRETTERVGAYTIPVEPSAGRNQRNRRQG